MVKVYLGIGSNMGDRKGNLDRAVQLLADKVRVEGVSSIYETEPVDYPDQPYFLNAALEVATDLGPVQLLSLVKGIEATLGRVPGLRGAPRPIDIDILLYDDQVIETPSLTIPHPRLAERAFALVPLSELAPDVVHPIIGKPIKEIEGRGSVRKWDEGDV